MSNHVLKPRRRAGKPSHSGNARQVALAQGTDEMFFNLSVDILAIADTNGYFLKISPSAQQILGHSKEELLSKPFIEFVHPDDVMPTLLEVKKLHSGKPTIEFSNRYLCADGTYKWLEWTCEPNGDLLLAVARDVTERKLAEQKLRESMFETEQYKYALDSAAIVSITDREGKILHVNDNFCRTSKYSREELLGQNLIGIMKARLDIDSFSHVFKRILRGKIWQGEICNYAKDGSVFWVEAIVVPLYDSSGVPSRFLGIRQDITERKLAEQELKSLYHHLEHRVAERTNQLVQSKIALEREKGRSESLLLNILPYEVAEELKSTGIATPRLFENVTVMLSDFSNFTSICENLTPYELVNELHECFKAFDDIMTRHNIEKIKTVGDAYLAVSGLPNPSADHAVNMVRAAVEIRSFLTQRNQQSNTKLHVRIGIHSGPVVAGIVGVKKFAYDIWGDTVNCAARFEQSSAPDHINISHSTYQLVHHRFDCAYRGEIHAKNKGCLKMYYVK